MWVQKVSGGAVQLLAYAPDGRTIYSLDYSGWVTAWDVAAQTRRRLFFLTGTDRPNAVRMTATADGHHLAIWTDQLQVWNLSAEPVRVELPPGFEWNETRLHPNGRELVTRGDRGLVTWSAERREPGPRIRAPQKRGTTLAEYAVAPDGRLFTAERSTRTGREWLVSGTEWWPLPDLYGWSYGMGFTADCRTLLFYTYGTDRLVLWDVPSHDTRTDARCRMFRGGAVVHPTAPVLAGHNHDRTLRLLSLETGAPVRALDFALGKRVLCAAFSPDGLTCAVGGSNKQFAVFDVDV